MPTRWQTGGQHEACWYTACKPGHAWARTRHSCSAQVLLLQARHNKERHIDPGPSPEVEVKHTLARILIVFIGTSGDPLDHERRLSHHILALQHEGTLLQTAGYGLLQSAANVASSAAHQGSAAESSHTTCSSAPQSATIEALPELSLAFVQTSTSAAIDGLPEPVLTIVHTSTKRTNAL